MMKRKGLFALAGLITALGGVPPALATVGGPELVEVLGWSPDQHRVYVHVISTWANDSFGDVVYFALDGPEPERAATWSRAPRGEGTARDSTLVAQLAALRRTLEPMVPMPAASLPFVARAARRDTVRDRYGEYVRYTTRARFDRETEFEVTAWFRPEVVLKDAYAVPGRSERLLVLAFFGDRSEGGYETQVPVMIARRGVPLRQVRWGPAE
ncbi:MAG: hypothetical protein HZC42_04640 [Candidatus Eisenbacteria bacterium]|nr:hypothetical protein [Candidatus Eisenbacteria bacterium]